MGGRGLDSAPGQSDRSAPSSRGQGHRPLTAKTRVRIPVGSLSCPLTKRRRAFSCPYAGPVVNRACFARHSSGPRGRQLVVSPRSLIASWQLSRWLVLTPLPGVERRWPGCVATTPHTRNASRFWRRLWRCVVANEGTRTPASVLFVVLYVASTGP